MANRITARSRRWILVVTLIGIASAGWMAPPQARSGDLSELDNSLKLIPHNAAFYSSMLRNREQIEAIASSRAWAKLMESPFVQQGLMMYQMQAADPQGPVGQYQAVMNNPEVRKLVDLGLDMVSQEIFVYGDESLVGFLELMQQFSGTMRYGPLMLDYGPLKLDATGQSRGLEQVQGMLMLATVCENLDLLKVPDVVIGFRLSNVELAKEQLASLEMLATVMLQSQPELAPLKDSFKKAKVGGHEYLTFTLDGKMAPWEEVPLDELREFEANQGDVDKLIAHLKKSKIVFALGVRDDYLLLSIGSSTRCLARLGKGKGLGSLPELKPLEKFTDQRLTGVGYVSKALMSQIGYSKGDIDDLLEVVNELLPLAELKPDLEAKIRKDAAALAEDLKPMIPEPGAVTTLSFLTDRGLESYSYNWGEQLLLDGSKPLGILQHLGGSPLMALAGRSKHSPGDYDLLVKWTKVAYGYFEQFALPKMSDSEREQFDRVVKLFGPLVERADRINREMLIPALADGQAGFVIDAKLRSKQFARALPPTEEPMPMIEPALVVGVSDAGLLCKAVVGYRDVINDVIQAVGEMNPELTLGGFKIPDPESTETEAGTIYNYPLPEMAGVDPQITPSFALSDTVAAVGISKDHVGRLLQATPLTIGGLLDNTDRPLATAVLLDFAGLIDTAAPWVDFALEMINQESGGDPVMAAMVSSQVDTVLQVLKVLRTVTGESYMEDGALVTHSLVEIRDIEE